MKFLIDAQLPKSLADFLSQNGHEALHTLDLPDKNRTPDKRIIEIAERGNYVVVTKDDDFLKAFYLKTSLKAYTREKREHFKYPFNRNFFSSSIEY